MKIAEFGGANNHSYGLDTIIGWLESLVSDEEQLAEESTSKHRAARLDQAEDALNMLYEVSEWSPRLTTRNAKRGQK